MRHLAETKTESVQLDKLDRVVDSSGKVAVLIGSIVFFVKIVIPVFEKILASI